MLPLGCCSCWQSRDVPMALGTVLRGTKWYIRGQHWAILLLLFRDPSRVELCALALMQDSLCDASTDLVRGGGQILERTNLLK